jgi:hypothetical protein
VVRQGGRVAHGPLPAAGRGPDRVDRRCPGERLDEAGVEPGLLRPTPVHWAGLEVTKAVAGAKRSLAGAWTRSLDTLRGAWAGLRRVGRLACGLPGTLAALVPPQEE